MFFLYFVTAYQLTGLISNFSFRSQSGIEAKSRDFRASAEGSTSVDPSVCYVVWYQLDCIVFKDQDLTYLRTPSTKHVLTQTTGRYYTEE